MGRFSTLAASTWKRRMPRRVWREQPMDIWVEAVRIRPTDELVRTAAAVVDRVVAAPSELLELWSETDDVEAWKGALAELPSRLGG